MGRKKEGQPQTRDGRAVFQYVEGDKEPTFFRRCPSVLHEALTDSEDEGGGGHERWQDVGGEDPEEGGGEGEEGGDAGKAHFKKHFRHAS